MITKLFFSSKKQEIQKQKISLEMGMFSTAGLLGRSGINPS
jgi:hypothetical protein